MDKTSPPAHHKVRFFFFFFFFFYLFVERDGVRTEEAGVERFFPSHSNVQLSGCSVLRMATDTHTHTHAHTNDTY